MSGVKKVLAIFPSLSNIIKGGLADGKMPRSFAEVTVIATNQFISIEQKFSQPAVSTSREVH